jgi:hypothetical protein
MNRLLKLYCTSWPKARITDIVIAARSNAAVVRLLIILFPELWGSAFDLLLKEAWNPERPPPFDPVGIELQHLIVELLSGRHGFH